MQGLLLFTEDIKEMSGSQISEVADCLEESADNLDQKFRWANVTANKPVEPEAYVVNGSPFFVLGILEDKEECRRMYILLDNLSDWFRKYHNGSISYHELSWYFGVSEILVP